MPELDLNLLVLSGLTGIAAMVLLALSFEALGNWLVNRGRERETARLIREYNAKGYRPERRD